LIQQLSGRLGNQLFQWAFAHRLAMHYGLRVKLFTDSSHGNTFRGDDVYSYMKNCNHTEISGQRDLTGLLIKNLDRTFSVSKSLTLTIEKKLEIFRTRNSYSIPELPIKPPRLITGFFINSKNVEIVEEVLFHELEKRIEQVGIPQGLPERYQFMHIRRGDYVTSASTYGLLGEEHYKNYRDFNLPLVVGTDDVGSSSHVIKDLMADFVFSPSNSSAWQTLRMMSMAESLVLANSTLSWWGGFLASNKGNSVLSPNPFYKNDLQNNEVLQYKKFVKVDSKFL